MPSPNVLLITVDQMRVHEMGCYGGTAPADRPNTPNIDRLAARGAMFEYAFTSNPVCTPARSSIVSGQYGRSCIGTVFNAAEPSEERVHFPCQTLAEILKGEGYETALVGKWHMHVSPYRLGFESCVYPKFNHLNKNQDYNIHGEKRIVEGSAYGFELEEARRFIQKKRGRPFFLYHNISMPHMPYFDMDDEFKYRYAKGELPPRANVRPGQNPEFDRHWFKIYMYDYLYYRYLGDRHTVLPDGFCIGDLYAMYRGMVYAADWQVGQLMEYVEAAGLANDTVVVFVSDHGDNMGSHGLYNKDCSYEESIRVPFVVSCPGRISPRVVKDDLASLIDAAPTILDLCGVQVPDHMQGVSLAPLFGGKDGKKTIGRDRVYVECSNGELVCRTKRHKLSVKEGKIHRFADLESDPYELSDDGAESLGHVVQELHESLMDWDARTKWMGEA